MDIIAKCQEQPWRSQIVGEDEEIGAQRDCVLSKVTDGKGWGAQNYNI